MMPPTQTSHRSAVPAPCRPCVLRVGVDAGPLFGEGGISEYIRPLLRALFAMDTESDFRLILRSGWHRPSTAEAWTGLPPLTYIRVPDRVLALCWDRLGWRLPIHRSVWNSLDVFLATCLVAPILPRGRLVSVLYDLIPLRLPGMFPDRERFRRRVARLIARSSAVVAISHRTRQDLVEQMEVDPALVHVLYPGRREGFGPASTAAIAEVTGRLGIHDPYILYVGALGRHKNIPTLLQAFEQVRRHGNVPVTLVLVGSLRWGAETLTALETLPIRDHVIVTGPVPDADLPPLYSGAACFVFPSLYEGFGLPVLEAMTCGTPAVVSNRGALPEVVGDAGLVVEADDPAAFAEAMCRLLDDPQLRARYAAAAVARAARFSWRQSAASLLALLRGTTLGGNPRA